ncbi:MAG: hypothetical protein DME26_07115 [Verrucomicrobia bacterium]|nr:MAG: hypothetical protein DME26_07115 [Verrucomicrobiota bacterium]
MEPAFARAESRDSTGFFKPETVVNRTECERFTLEGAELPRLQIEENPENVPSSLSHRHTPALHLPN